MKMKCHYCGQNLKLGINYTFECECGNCKIGFDKSGKVDCFEFSFFEKGRDIFLRKYKYSENVIYNLDRKSNFELNLPLKFSEDGIPEVYMLWERMKCLIIFS